MKSNIREIGPVTFPDHTGERVYMRPFTLREGLPEHLSRWQPTVDAMLAGIFTELPIYIMIDQGEVAAGNTHRRGGAHIDGNWIAEVSGWDQGGGRWSVRSGRHGGGHRGTVRNGVWRSDDFSPEALILASDVSACVAYDGEIEGDPLEGGSCDHLDLSSARRIRLLSGVAYSGNVTMVHESVPVERSCKRTLVRLSVPGVEI